MFIVICSGRGDDDAGGDWARARKGHPSSRSGLESLYTEWGQLKWGRPNIAAPTPPERLRMSLWECLSPNSPSWMRLAISLNTALIDFFVLEGLGSQYRARWGKCHCLFCQTRLTEHACGNNFAKQYYVFLHVFVAFSKLNIQWVVQYSKYYNKYPPNK